MPDRPPCRTAVAVTLLVLAGYILTLAPTVTFWDAGEFITAARTLGIPHPPGTPLFVLLANVWGRLVPLGGYAWRINLLSAVCTASAAGFWFLVAHDTIRRLHRDVDQQSRATLATLGATSAAVLIAFSFTVWQSATEAEVYASALLTSAVAAWLVTLRRTRRDDATGGRLLLGALLMGALSIGNHMMGLLVGPAIIGLLVVDASILPLEELKSRRSEWTQIGVISASWFLCIGLGLANWTLCGIGACLLLVAAGKAARAKQLTFALVAVALVAIGTSVLLFIHLRALQQPWLDSGSPGTWHALLDVVRRSQYPPRTPFDDPTVMHGPGNPGRTLTLLAYQVANYFQYFDWQWASSLGDLSRASVVRLAFTLVMATLAVRGAFAQWRADRGSFALIALLFITAGPLLLLYLNFRPGPSIGWDRWLNLVDHEVRDRDYFFVASFVAVAFWVALGLTDLVRGLVPRTTGALRVATVGIFAVALIPFGLNFRAATRRQTPEATLARNTAHALLGSVPANAILFTYGDNDTFPLWYAQQVEGFRTDVTVVCLALGQTAWYIKQFSALHGMTDAQVDALRPFRAPTPFTFNLGAHGTATIATGDVVNPADVLAINILRRNAGIRPVAWAISAADALFGLQSHLVQQGLALVLPVVPIAPSDLVGGAAAAPGGSPLDLPTTRRMVSNWWFGALEVDGPARLDANIRAVAATIAAPISQAGIALLIRGDSAGGLALLRRAVRLGDDSLAKVILARPHG
jgi:transmembrane protein TMEM260 (protein O-mannosyltransferase)